MLYDTYKMPSLRRSMSAVQRDFSAHNGESIFDISSPPKLPHNPNYLALGRLLRSFSNSLDFRGVSSPRTSWPIDQNRNYLALGRLLSSKPKGLRMRRSFFHYCLCFMLGVFISCTPFLSINVSKNLPSRQQAFSFEDETLAYNTQRKIDSLKIENLSSDKPVQIETHSLEAVEKLEVKSEVLDASHEIQPALMTPPSHDVELVTHKLLIIVTPTYERPFQAYYLNRLAHTLRVVPPPLIWIVVEMSSQSTETAKILRESGVMYRHLVCNLNVTGTRNREVHQRNVALSHIEKHQLHGIVHFADDDRTQSVDLFDQMRQIRRFGAWPIAVLSESKNKVLLEGPVCNGSQIIGWHTKQRSKLSRRFHVDMSGFAFNSTVLWDPKRWHRPSLVPIRLHDKSKEGFQETTFIEQLIEDESQMEGFPSDCSKIMAWHLNLEAPKLLNPKGWSVQKNLEVVAPLT